MSVKTVKLKSYEELQKNKQQQKQKQLDLYINGASKECLKDNTYSSRQDYHKSKEIERLTQLIAAAEEQGNIIKAKEYRSELDEFNIVCKKKERSKLIKELKVILKKLYYSFIQKRTNK